VKDTFVAKIMLQVVVSCFFVFLPTPREMIQYLTSIFFQMSRHHQLEKEEDKENPDWVTSFNEL